MIETDLKLPLQEAQKELLREYSFFIHYFTEITPQ